jgi:hypothetical protein
VGVCVCVSEREREREYTDLDRKWNIPQSHPSTIHYQKPNSL